MCIRDSSYDESKGRWSDISVLELVRDPWLPVVYAGIIMMMLGAICLFVNAQKRKEEEMCIRDRFERTNPTLSGKLIYPES